MTQEVREESNKTPVATWIPVKHVERGEKHVMRELVSLTRKTYEPELVDWNAFEG